MANKTKKSNTKSSTVKKEENDGLSKKKEMDKVLLHPFFVSAVKNIYNTENENWDLMDSTDRSGNFNEKQGD